MGLRFRRSIKIAPGIKININKKSISTTIGGKGFHYTVNSNGRKTTSVNLPVKGLSYTSVTTGKKGAESKSQKEVVTSSIEAVRSKSDSAPKDKPIKYKYTVLVEDVPDVFNIIFGILLLIAAFFISGFSVILAICVALLGLMCIYMYIQYKRNPSGRNYLTAQMAERWQSLVGLETLCTVSSLAKASKPLIIELKNAVLENASAAAAASSQADFQKYSESALESQKQLVALSEFITLKNDNPDSDLQKLTDSLNAVYSDKI